jgi:hypothetical protein
MLEAVLVLAGAVADALRPRWALLAEIALLRHQLTVLQRSVARPRVTRFDRIALVALAAVTPTWRNVLRSVQPETLLRWHRADFKALWRWRSRTHPASRLAPETAALVRSMASANRLWGAERIRGELLKLGAQQLRNATPSGAAPRFLIRDRDDKFATAFDALARATGIRMIRTAVRAPNMNAVCERFLGSLRRECLDHVLVLDGRHFRRAVAEYVRYHNAARPHQGIHQQTPVPAERSAEGNIVALPVLGGLHHEYRRAA